MGNSCIRPRMRTALGLVVTIVTTRQHTGRRADQYTTTLRMLSLGVVKLTGISGVCRSFLPFCR